MVEFRLVWAFVLCTGLALAGCGSDCKTICEKTDECFFDLDVDQCTEDCEDAIDDGRVDDDDIADCAGCVDDNSCSELLAGDCDRACAGTEL